MKKFAALLLAAAMCLCFAACSSGTDDKFYSESDPIQITDGAGRKVSFAQPVETVATTWGGTCDSYFFALQVQDRLVATNSTNEFHQLLIPDMENMGSVGRWAVDKEALAQLSPQMFVHGLGGVENFKDVNKVGVPAVALSLNSFAEVQGSLEMLGKAFGTEDRAAYVNGRINDVLELVRQRTEGLSEEDKYTVVVLGEETGTVASDLYNNMEEMIALAGGVSCVPEDIAKKPEMTNVGLETIFKWNADYIFLMNYYCELTVEDILADSSWSALNAVANDCVRAIPSGVDSWANATPSCCLGVLYMSVEMYPQLYADVDVEQVVLEFYRDVYGLDITRDQLIF